MVACVFAVVGICGTVPSAVVHRRRWEKLPRSHAGEGDNRTDPPGFSDGVLCSLLDIYLLDYEYGKCFTHGINQIISGHIRSPSSDQSLSETTRLWFTLMLRYCCTLCSSDGGLCDTAALAHLLAEWDVYGTVIAQHLERASIKGQVYYLDYLLIE